MTEPRIACTLQRGDHAVLIDSELQVYQLEAALQKREKEKGPFTALESGTQLRDVVSQLGFGEVIQVFPMRITVDKTVITAS